MNDGASSQAIELDASRTEEGQGPGGESGDIVPILLTAGVGAESTSG